MAEQTRRRTTQQQPAPQPPGKEVEVRGQGGLTRLIEDYREDFTATVPAHISPDAFISLAIAYVRRNPDLKHAAAVNPASLILALRECAALGHVPVKGTYALVAFRSKDAPGGWAVTGIEEVRGVVQRMYRAGGVTSVHVQLVHASDVFRWQPHMTLPAHEFDWQASQEQRGPITGVYAWARLRGGGTSQVVLMNMEQVGRYEAVAKTDKFWRGPWRPEMIQKTVLHRLEKFVPTSASYITSAVAIEAAASRGYAGVADVPTARGVLRDPDDVVDAEILDDPPPEPGPPPPEPSDVGWPDTAEPGSGAPAGGDR